MNDTPPVVLIIDDEPQIRRFLRAGFDIEHFTVLEEETGEAGLRTATLRQLDLIVVDLNLPDMDGASIVERVRAWSTVPIIVLSVRASDEDKVSLLECGADDYVVKPFSMAELLARARTALRRQARGAKGEPVVKLGGLTIDLAARAVFNEGTRVVLSPKEYRLLQVLAQHAGNVVTHNILLKEVWGKRHMQNSHYLADPGAEAAPQDRAGSEAAAYSGQRTRRRVSPDERDRPGLTRAIYAQLSFRLGTAESSTCRGAVFTRNLQGTDARLRERLRLASIPSRRIRSRFRETPNAATRIIAFQESGENPAASPAGRQCPRRANTFDE